MPDASTNRLQGELFTECAEWIWEQLQEEGVYMAGELVELILQVERDLGIQTATVDHIAPQVTTELQRRGVGANPEPVGEPVVRAVLEWEDEFLGFAGIPRSEA